MSVTPVSLAGLPASLPTAPMTEAAPGSSHFNGIVERMLGGAAQSHASAESAVRDLVAGRTDNVHGVLLQVAQADLTFRLILEIRNRLTEAYQDIMKMQI